MTAGGVTIDTDVSLGVGRSASDGIVSVLRMRGAFGLMPVTSRLCDRYHERTFFRWGGKVDKMVSDCTSRQFDQREGLRIGKF